MILREKQWATKEFVLANSIPEPNSGCWIWLGTMNRSGYGAAVAHYPGLSSMWAAHRLSFFVFKENLVKGLMIRHLCHNKICVNPDHLAQGTAKDNCDDNKRKWA